MFAFTKEQKQDKLARINVDNYNKLEFSLSTVTDSLQREAILNAMADIADIFTMLRSTYDLSRPVKTPEDYRLLRVLGMPGIILDYRGYPREDICVRAPYYRFLSILPHVGDLQQYFINALQSKKLKEAEATYNDKAKLYGVTAPFSEDNFDTLFNLEETLQYSGRSNAAVVVDIYNRELCEQFAHHTNLDILISTKGN